MMIYDKISGFSDEIAEAVEVQFQVLNKLGIRYFEPRGIDGKNISLLSEAEVCELKACMDRYGIKVSSIGSPIGKVKLEEPFEEHFALFRKVVQTAKALEAGYIRLFSFYHVGGPEWTESERAEVLARLRRMISYAEEHDIVLLHENEKDIYGDTVERCVDLMRELSGSHFKAVFDPANFVQCHQDTAAAYEQLKSYIAYMHIKDADASDGKVVPAGFGDGNVEYILGDLFKNGYDGFLSLEPHLGNFAGLAALELDDKMKDLPEGGEGTFTLAYNALENILNRILV
ncbi:MAG: sugar phosphate isomerase/epimerase [Lachnospiraceae bacterium]|nr:sugar phosphate isomerase/epimerase [Lachnospiraceae bacterium]